MLTPRTDAELITKLIKEGAQGNARRVQLIVIGEMTLRKRAGDMASHDLLKAALIATGYDFQAACLRSSGDVTAVLKGDAK